MTTPRIFDTPLRIARRATAAVLLLAAASSIALPVRAETPVLVARGTITLPNFAGGASPEVLPNMADGCKGTRSDGVLAAIVDLRAHQGKTIRFTGEGTEVPSVADRWRIVRGTQCSAATIGGPVSYVDEPGTLTWENNAYAFLYVVRDPQPEVGLNGRYRVEAIEP